MVSKKGRELEFPYIGNYSSQRGVEGNLGVPESWFRMRVLRVDGGRFFRPVYFN